MYLKWKYKWAIDLHVAWCLLFWTILHYVCVADCLSIHTIRNPFILCVATSALCLFHSPHFDILSQSIDQGLFLYLSLKVTYMSCLLYGYTLYNSTCSVYLLELNFPKGHDISLLTHVIVISLKCEHGKYYTYKIQRENIWYWWDYNHRY